MRLLIVLAFLCLYSCGTTDQLEYPTYSIDDIKKTENTYLSKNFPLPFGTIQNPAVWNISESASPDGDMTVFQTEESKFMFIVLPEKYNTLKKANQFVKKRIKQISIKMETDGEYLVGMDLQRKYYGKAGIKDGRTFYWFLSFISQEDVSDEQLIAEQIESDFFWVNS